MALGVTGQTETGGGAQRARAAVCVTAVTSHALSLRARVCSEGSGGVASWPEGNAFVLGSRLQLHLPLGSPRTASAPAFLPRPTAHCTSFPTSCQARSRGGRSRVRPRLGSVCGDAHDTAELAVATDAATCLPPPSGPPRAPASRRASHGSALSVLEAPPHLLIGDFINLIPT